MLLGQVFELVGRDRLRVREVVRCRGGLRFNVTDWKGRPRTLTVSAADLRLAGGRA